MNVSMSVSVGVRGCECTDECSHVCVCVCWGWEKGEVFECDGRKGEGRARRQELEFARYPRTLTC